MFDSFETSATSSRPGSNTLSPYLKYLEDINAYSKRLGAQSLLKYNNSQMEFQEEEEEEEEEEDDDEQEDADKKEDESKRDATEEALFLKVLFFHLDIFWSLGLIYS